MDEVERLAKAIFEIGGCEFKRCAWGYRPCCCQERDMRSAADALRGLDHLEVAARVYRGIGTVRDFLRSNSSTKSL